MIAFTSSTPRHRAIAMATLHRPTRCSELARSGAESQSTKETCSCYGSGMSVWVAGDGVLSPSGAIEVLDLLSVDLDGQLRRLARGGSVSGCGVRPGLSSPEVVAGVDLLL